MRGYELELHQCTGVQAMEKTAEQVNVRVINERGREFGLGLIRRKALKICGRNRKRRSARDRKRGGEGVGAISVKSSENEGAINDVFEGVGAGSVSV